ncbi:hypothetical protein JD844_002295 [Phrynosoma platyrhinos]|uniref:Uncharacterized protein n=1 Tax=Phrynosoma platyrhinos TaxID=52577 RepID=A0ABQ7TBT7_PHRPL|nr:hypothetical protein JD844_002295 [Phrynosoma platyrhinos]
MALLEFLLLLFIFHMGISTGYTLPGVPLELESPSSISLPSLSSLDSARSASFLDDELAILPEEDFSLAKADTSTIASSAGRMEAYSGTAIQDPTKGRAENGKEAETLAAPLLSGQVPYSQAVQPRQCNIQTGSMIQPPTGIQEPPGILSLQYLEQSSISSISLNQMVKDLQLHIVQSLAMADGVLRAKYPMCHSRSSCSLGCPHPRSL